MFILLNLTKAYIKPYNFKKSHLVKSFVFVVELLHVKRCAIMIFDLLQSPWATPGISPALRARERGVV